MADRFLWLGGSRFDLAADWADLGGAASLPGPGDAATIAAAGALDATGTLTAASLTLAGALSLAPSGAVALGGGAPLAGSVVVAAAGSLAGSGRIDAPIVLAGTLAAIGGALGLFATVGGSGTLAIGAGATLYAAGAVAAGVTAAFTGAAGTLELFTDTAAFAAGVTGFAAGDAIAIADAAITGAAWAAGALDLAGADGNTLALALPGSFAAADFVVLPDGFGGTAIMLADPIPLPATAATLALSGGPVLCTGAGHATVVAASGTVTLAGSLDAGAMEASGLLTIQGGTLSVGTLSLSGTLAAIGGRLQAGGIGLLGGTLSADAAAGITVGITAGGGAAAAGTLGIAAGGTLAGSGRIAAALACAGTLLASGGALGLFGAATGAGTLAIAAGATLFAGGAVGAGLTVAFAGAGGTLNLAAVGQFAATIAGLAPGDALDIGFTTLDAAAWSPGRLTLGGGGVERATLAVAGSHDPGGYRITPDGAGGSLIAVIACFCPGTGIATPDGPREVERLRPGDMVLTPAGPRPLCWTGRSDRAAAPELRPVRLAASSLGPGRPLRALLLSPEHALLLDGALVPAIALLGRQGITRAPLAATTYHHIGTEMHTLVLAEGTWAETFLPHATGADPAATPPFDEEHGTRPAGPPCAPRRHPPPAEPPPAAPPPVAPPAGRLLGHLERMVPDGALVRLEGWALDAAEPQRPVTLEVLRDFSPLARIRADRWRPDLDHAGLADGRCGFVATLLGPGRGLTLRRVG